MSSTRGEATELCWRYRTRFTRLREGEGRERDEGAGEPRALCDLGRPPRFGSGNRGALIVQCHTKPFVLSVRPPFIFCFPIRYQSEAIMENGEWG